MHDELHALEQERAQAIANRDYGRLGEILAPGYVHIHADGRVEDRDVWLAGQEAGPARTTERGDLRIVSAGDTAGMVGRIITTILPPDREPIVIDGTATQAWARVDGGWRLLSLQVTRTP